MRVFKREDRMNIRFALFIENRHFLEFIMDNVFSFKGLKCEPFFDLQEFMQYLEKSSPEFIITTENRPILLRQIRSEYSGPIEFIESYNFREEELKELLDRVLMPYSTGKPFKMAN